MSVRLGEPGDASEEDIEDGPERPAAGREARWARIAQSAVKQCLRRAPIWVSCLERWRGNVLSVRCIWSAQDVLWSCVIILPMCKKAAKA